MAISPPQLTSLVVKSPQSISCPTDHMGTGPRIGGKISCDAYVSSCWRYGILVYIINAHPALHQMAQTSLWAADLDSSSLILADFRILKRRLEIAALTPSTAPWGTVPHHTRLIYVPIRPRAKKRDGLVVARVSCRHGSRARLDSNFPVALLSQRNHIDSARRACSVRVRGDKDCGEECLAGIKNLDIVSSVDI